MFRRIFANLLNTKEILSFYSETSEIRQLLDTVRSGEKVRADVKGTIGSFRSVIASVIHQQTGHNLLIIMRDLDEVKYFQNDLESFLGEYRVDILPASFRNVLDTDHVENTSVQARAEVLLKLSKGDTGHILVTSHDALLEKVIAQDRVRSNQFEINIGDILDIDFLLEFMQEFHFQREDFVYEPGQFAIRGGIIDVFSYAHDLPFRFELNGREIESIRTFDPIGQLSVSEVRFTTIVPNIQNNEIAGEKQSIFKYLKKDWLIIGNELSTGIDALAMQYERAEPGEEDFLSIEEYRKAIRDHDVINFGRTFFRGGTEIEFHLTPQPSFGKNFEMLIRHLKENESSGITSLIFSDSNKQIERLDTIFEDLNAGFNIKPVFQPLSEGFLDKENKLACYTEHQIFDRHFQYKGKTFYSKNTALTIKELRDLKPGDFVVHIDHGVGVFQGLQKVEMAGRIQEAVRLSYKNDDLLYVNIGSLHKISKYTGKEGHQPKLNKLGSDAWSNLKRKTKKKVKDIARDLIKLYAKRKAEDGFAFSPDSYLQVELEASFLYEDTPDQAKATEDLKRDMESPHPMDRLICGDVGFGKTEVAIRAAFKAVTDSKQVAVLVPTTILAQQHYHTFKDRLEGLPCTVDYINRFRTKKQQTETLKNLEEGKVDIIIGTHRLLNKNINFSNLGLLIIDEEQKFGVAAKEKLKQLRVSVDTLTLTATPIPRTLHFSLMGARDLSVINTPPLNRQPIKTELHTFNKDILRDAIDREMERGGQVFVVHNRVRDIEEVASLIRGLCPDARVTVGHGQMHGDELENVMVQFVEGDYDVLVATTIIESGLDIPNANTIIINNAHFFGLSDLHQMRGRVGRSNKKAYCILFCPAIHSLTDDARRRLQAIEEFSDLGSGFNVALRDLDIRGAGNLLGGEQSGFISEIGFDMYHKILDEAIKELKEDEFSDLFKDEPHQDEIRECSVESDHDLAIPDHYVRNIAERLNLYNELSRISDEAKLEDYKTALEDRFGPLPSQVTGLLDSVRLKWLGMKIGFEKIRIKGKNVSCYFPPENDEKYYQSYGFKHILRYIQTDPRFRLEQKGPKLILRTAVEKSSVLAVIDRLVKLEPIKLSTP